MMARLLPIQGHGVPTNVATDFSTEAAFLFLSSSARESPFSVGDSLAFTEKMTSIWFAFTPPEQGVYSLYIFHAGQEVGAAEFDVYGKGFYFIFFFFFSFFFSSLILFQKKHFFFFFRCCW